MEHAGSPFPYLLENWNYLGNPPQDALEQFAQIWHLEYVLRHFIYANLQLRFGRVWPAKLDQLRLRDGKKLELKKRQVNASQSKDYGGNRPPSELWFASLGGLIAIVEQLNLWKSLPAHRQQAFCRAITALGEQRNFLFHLSPVPSNKIKAELGKSARDLDGPMKDWMRLYWNADPVTREHPIVKDYDSWGKGIPLLTKPIPGVHGGFRDDTRAVDRGWSILFLQNSECYWAEVAAIGVPRDFGTADLSHLSRGMQDEAIHVAACFHEREPIQDILHQGFFMLRVSFGKKEGDAAVVGGLKNLSEITKNLSLVPTPNRKNGTQELERRAILRELFYNVPWNFIVAPVQERAVRFRINSKS